MVWPRYGRLVGAGSMHRLTLHSRPAGAAGWRAGRSSRAAGPRDAGCPDVLKRRIAVLGLLGIIPRYIYCENMSRFIGQIDGH